MPKLYSYISDFASISVEILSGLRKIEITIAVYEYCEGAFEICCLTDSCAQTLGLSSKGELSWHLTCRYDEVP